MLELLVVLVVALAVAAGCLYSAMRHEQAMLQISDRDYARLAKTLDNEQAAHNITRDRLFSCVKEGFVIPPAPEPDQPPDISLPDELAPIWENWESPLGQEKQKAVLRALIKSGRTASSLLEEYGFIPSK